MSLFLEKNHETLKLFAQENKLTYLGLFGSHARNEEGINSDVDLLVEYPVGTSLFDVVRMERKLSSKLQKKVDLVSRKYVNKYVKPYIEKDLIGVYEQE